MSPPADNVSSTASPAAAMGDDAIAHFSNTPWCRHLINSPEWTPRPTGSRVPKASTEDSFYAETLKTDRTIRALLTLRPTEESQDGDMTYKEVRSLMDLGNGLNGFPEIAHGGFVATMLDEVMGVLIVLDIETRSEKKKEQGLDGQNEIMACYTAYLNTTYKKPVPTPSIVLCTARLVRKERNKIYLRATIEDGQGTVYTIGEGMFVQVGARL